MEFGTLELLSTVENIFLGVKALPVAYQLVCFLFPLKILVGDLNPWHTQKLFVQSTKRT